MSTSLSGRDSDSLTDFPYAEAHLVGSLENRRRNLHAETQRLNAKLRDLESATKRVNETRESLARILADVTSMEDELQRLQAASQQDVRDAGA